MRDGWKKEELRASVDAYVEMQRKERNGEHFIKKNYYKALTAKFGRTEKAFEYRMQNISYVMTLLGRDWLTGLKPAKNVGASVAAEIEKMIAQAEGRQFIPIVAFEIEAREEAKKKDFPKPIGRLHPTVSPSIITQYQRDSSVKAWVLKQANGKCELCNQFAPFNTPDGHPFLEIHHARQLAENGSDTVTNTVALCPNCHRELHYGENSKKLTSLLYERVPRLICE